MADNYIGGRTRESDENDQLILGLYKLENPLGIVTIPKRTNSPRNLQILLDQLSDGIVVASKSFYDKRPIDTIAEELAKIYDGSGGDSLASGDQYRSVEFATKSKEQILAEYFK